MSKSEILAELPKLNLEERRAIFDRLCEIEEHEVLAGAATPEEKQLLDREWEEYQRSSNAGSTWEDVKARMGKPSNS